MGLFIYNFSIWFYHFIVWACSAWNNKAKLFTKGRENIFDKIKDKIAGNNKKVAWFHCSSLGEFEQARPVIEGFKKINPDFFIFITFFSPSGYEARKNYNGADAVFYLPKDTLSNAERLIDITKPVIAYFVKYDFWFHYLSTLKKNNVPAILFSANFRENQLFFKPYGSFYRKILFLFSNIFVQNEKSAILLKKIKYYASLAGDTRFDRVIENANLVKTFPLIEKFKNNYKILIAGSTWSEDVNILVELINKFEGPLKFIIAPHEIKEKYLQEIENKTNPKTLRFSMADENNVEEAVLLIIDNIGMLSSLYQYGNIAYVGGGFKQGLHNILEPAVFGLPILFGPEKDFQKFPEAKEMMEADAAFTVKNESELIKIIEKLTKDENFKFETGENAKKYILANTGATDKILNWKK